MNKNYWGLRAHNSNFPFMALTILFVLSACAGNVDTRKAESSACGEYIILEDRKDTQISAAVNENISESELKCALMKIADARQFDRDRDYLTSDYLWVNAYLARGNQLSKVPAAKLRRKVPTDKSQAGHATEDNMFQISLDYARGSF